MFILLICLVHWFDKQVKNSGIINQEVNEEYPSCLLNLFSSKNNYVSKDIPEHFVAHECCKSKLA